MLVWEGGSGSQNEERGAGVWGRRDRLAQSTRIDNGGRVVLGAHLSIQCVVVVLRSVMYIRIDMCGNTRKCIHGYWRNNVEEFHPLQPYSHVLYILHPEAVTQEKAPDSAFRSFMPGTS